MALALHTLHPAVGSTRRRRRVGRGHGSGRGKTAGRGTKGQRARTGGTKGLKRLGVRRMVLSIPKKRGFHHAPRPVRPLTWNHIHTIAIDGQHITRSLLVEQGLIRSSEIPKIINTGTLRHEGITVQGITMTKGARKQLIAKGGKEQKDRETKKLSN